MRIAIADRLYERAQAAKQRYNVRYPDREVLFTATFVEMLVERALRIEEQANG